ncbi:hypothetical protein KJ819_00910 [Patescibacteria group bacterium]|nr:hypothetical protein [Patescibacteria group bacterium]MBU1500713.1 hypothetical protein [Patescibacteria group bacterium]MBU2080415.1 hypothetical protein [Patescibacteria group bacterium]MBU2194376.1 hypothetical protein [Patescibacteria group bacterium]MBU2330055.1 hypothetical protein [Patescibacteria group bacterium]
MQKFLLLAAGAIVLAGCGNGPVRERVVVNYVVVDQPILTVGACHLRVRLAEEADGSPTRRLSFKKPAHDDSILFTAAYESCTSSKPNDLITRTETHVVNRG